MKHGFVGLRWATVGVLVVFLVLIWQAVWQAGPRDHLEVAFLDVGQGDATLVTAPGGNRLLIDGGLGPVVLPALNEVLPFHDRRIEVLLATHPHADHIGGLPFVLDRFEVQAVIDNDLSADTEVYRRFERSIADSGVEHLSGRRGMVIHLDKETVFVVLFPDRKLYPGMDPDDGSIIGQVLHGETSFMFTGDAGQAIERYVSFLDGPKLDSEVLKAGHHGSRTSTAFEFVGWVDPDYAVISAGADNRYGHPHSEVIETLEQFEVGIEATAESGTVIFHSDGRKVECLTCR